MLSMMLLRLRRPTLVLLLMMVHLLLEVLLPLCLLRFMDGITLRQILRAFELKIVDFFKEIPQFCIKVGFVLTALYGSDWEKKIEAFMHTHKISFFPVSKLKHILGITEEHTRSYSYQMTAVLTIHMPMRLRNFSIKDSAFFAKKSDKGVNLVASLCERYLTSEDEFHKALEKTNNLIMDILQKKPCLDATDCQQGSLSFIDPDPGKGIENALNTNGELDELMFANDEDSLLGSGSLSGGAIKLPGMKKYDVMASPTKSTTSRAPMSPPRFCASPTGNGFCNSKMAPFTVSPQ